MSDFLSSSSALRVRQWERDRRERFNTLMVALAKLLPDFHKDNDKALAEAKGNKTNRSESGSEKADDQVEQAEGHGGGHNHSAGTGLKWSKAEILERAIKHLLDLTEDGLEDGEPRRSNLVKRVRSLRKQNR
jgi:hypothetical protein